jgi:8-oxo-dGTP pyrophosphatase MutT (NUDIX family)
LIRRLHLGLLHLYRRLPKRARIAVIHTVAPGFSVGAICVVERDDGRVLVVRHSYRNAWGFPGGLLKRGEEVADGARREAREEVGIEVELLGEPAVVVAPEPRRVDVVYRARPADGVDPDSAHPVSPEIVDVRWAPVDELPELQHEAAGGLVALRRAERAR